MPPTVPTHPPRRSDRQRAGPYGLPGPLGASEEYAKAVAMAGICQGRIDVDGGSTLRLQFHRYNGKYIEVDGEVCEIPTDEDVDGLTGEGSAWVVRTTDTIIQPEGGITGTAIAASTLYYAYVCNSRGSGASVRRVRLSTNAPVERATDGARYLSDEGGGRHWRFVGYARTNATPAFVDTTTDRLVVNWYNQAQKNILLRPGYSDNNANTSWTTASTSWVAANGGTGATGSYISDGRNAIQARAHATSVNSGANTNRVGLGIDSTTSPVVAGLSTLGATGVAAHSCSYSEISSEGYHTISLTVAVDGGTGTYYADTGRSGATADVPNTYLEAVVLA